MLSDLAYYLILGKPVIFYLGILTFFSFSLTAVIPILNQKGIHKIPFVWHVRFAKLSFALAIIHALLGISTYF
jgi:hypothetical protein